MADVYNMTVDKAATHSFTLTYQDANGDPIDLSAHSVRMDVREGYVNSDLVFSLTNGLGIDMTNATSGVLLITMTPAQTVLLVEDIYKYDLKINSAGVVTRLIQGKINSIRQVTA